MTPVEKLFKQHEEIIEVLNNIEAKSKENLLDLALEDIKKLSGLIEEHLLLEDDFLYPVLKKRPDEKVREKAVEFEKSFGGLKIAFVNYIQKWNTVDLLQSLNEEFLNDTTVLVSSLNKRIKSEEVELFPLLKTK